MPKKFFLLSFGKHEHTIEIIFCVLDFLRNLNNSVFELNYSLK